MVSVPVTDSELLRELGAIFDGSTKYGGTVHSFNVNEVSAENTTKSNISVNSASVISATCSAEGFNPEQSSFWFYYTLSKTYPDVRMYHRDSTGIRRIIGWPQEVKAGIMTGMNWSGGYTVHPDPYDLSSFTTEKSPSGITEIMYKLNETESVIFKVEIDYNKTYPPILPSVVDSIPPVGKIELEVLSPDKKEVSLNLNVSDNISNITSVYIDNYPPEANIGSSISNNMELDVKNPTAKLRITQARDNITPSSEIQMRFTQFDGGSHYSNWMPIREAFEVKLPKLEGIYNIDIQLRDNAGNMSALITIPHRVVDRSPCWPVPSMQKISTAFGVDREGGARPHVGIDIPGYNDRTRKVLAFQSGVVIHSGTKPRNGAKGIHVVINHDTPGNRMQTVYEHLQAELFSVGHELKQGDLVGLMGNTGSCSPMPTPKKPNNGIHLHYEIRVAEIFSSQPLSTYLAYPKLWMYADSSSDPSDAPAYNPLSFFKDLSVVAIGPDDPGYAISVAGEPGLIKNDRHYEVCALLKMTPDDMQREGITRSEISQMINSFNQMDKVALAVLMRDFEAQFATPEYPGSGTGSGGGTFPIDLPFTDPVTPPSTGADS